MIGRTPAHISATRPLRDGVIADFAVTEQMLRHFIRKAAHTGRSRADVMVCVPSGITQVERNAVTRATLAAGATHAYLIEEPMAAAIGAGLPVAEPVGALVVDIGGGTTETAVTALGGLAVVNSIKVGGYQMDDAIVRAIQQRERLLIGQEQARGSQPVIVHEGNPVELAVFVAVFLGPTETTMPCMPWATCWACGDAACPCRRPASTGALVRTPNPGPAPPGAHAQAHLGASGSPPW